MDIVQMKKFTTYEAADFSLERAIELKRGKRLVVVFSTLGEREMDTVAQKIALLEKKAGRIIDVIMLAHRRLGATEERTEIEASRASKRVEIMVANTVQVPDMGREQGKGADMRRCLYEINRRCKSDGERARTAVAFLDADVLPEYFGPHFVFGLSGAVFDGNDFAKASFWRELGRVKKYLAQPLNSLISHPELESLTRLAYPLSGEVAGTLDFFNSVCFWQGYGVETGINIDASMGDYSIADVNLGTYDHDHRDDLAIQKMSFGILRTFFTQMIDYWIIELKKGAKLGDAYRASFIDPDGCRQEMEFELKEKKYRPLREIL